MAHIETLREVAPRSRDIIHLGATSCYVTDNTDLVLMRESLAELAENRFHHRFPGTIRLALEVRADAWLHPFSTRPVDHGRQAPCLWCYDLVFDLQDLEYRRDHLKFRGARVRPAPKPASWLCFGATTTRCDGSTGSSPPRWGSMKSTP